MYFFKGQGRSEPVPVEIKLGRGGLGRDTEIKRKQEHRIEMSRNRAFKRQKMESKHKQDFMHRQNTKFAEKNVEKDLYKSQKVCEQLDSQSVGNFCNILIGPGYFCSIQLGSSFHYLSCLFFFISVLILRLSTIKKRD